MEVLWLSRGDVASLGVTMVEAMAEVERGFRLKGQGKVEMPAKIGVHTRPDCFLHAMPCFVSGEVDVSGLKWVGGYPPNQAKGLPYITGIYCLNDCETGFPLSVMDASWLTALRTGAATGVCARHLAAPGAEVAGMVGLGVQARTSLLALREALPNLRRVQVYDLFPSQTGRFVADQEPLLPGVELVPCLEAEAAVREADVTVTCVPIVTDPKRFIPAAWLKPDALAISVDYDAAYCEDVMAGLFVCDDREQYLWTQEHGVYFRGYPGAEGIYGDMGDLCAGKTPPAREGRRGAVLMGIALDDALVGSLLYRRARERGVGKTLEL
ncbi:Ornithine cyclodeaminase [Aminomonas paucivorans DSM 12260]|uniref:Ornithine cyclodeaminase n=1 Tax=Aminomonas paucivorans DSM 12260 TaxID=584708 RepID=E3CVJ3_9BACT|nr:ornithine cyclodeaminase family protein [Aminomonas paucivorans]EFQ24184.1 Ornithine cyclodeaminase [Aminomonas paucivorans DSM 12260]